MRGVYAVASPCATALVLRYSDCKIVVELYSLSRHTRRARPSARPRSGPPRVAPKVSRTRPLRRSGTGGPGRRGTYLTNFSHFFWNQCSRKFSSVLCLEDARQYICEPGKGATRSPLFAFAFEFVTTNEARACTGLSREGTD